MNGKILSNIIYDILVFLMVYYNRDIENWFGCPLPRSDGRKGGTYVLNRYF